MGAGQSQPEPSITIEQALRLPSLRRGAPEVLAGRRNLGRHIRWVHSSEVPNIATLLRGGELLLMTGMGLGTSARAQRRFIRELAGRGVAGLVIELGQVFRDLPAAVSDEAETRALPLIALHKEVPFIDVTEEIHRQIAGHELSVLSHGARLEDQFTRLMLAGAGIDEVLAALAEAIANPVILEKRGTSALYQAPHRISEAEVLAAWEVIAPELDQGTPPAMPVLSCEVPGTGPEPWGRLVALGLATGLDDYDRVVVERAAGLVALALLRTHQEAVLAARQRGNFLTLLAQGRLDPRDIEDRIRSLGFPPDAGPLLPLAFTIAGDHGESADEQAWTPVWQHVRQELRERGLPALIGVIGSPGEALGLIGLRTPEAREPTADAVAQIFRAAVRRHVGRPEEVVIAAGPAVAGWPDVAEALRRTNDAAVAARDAPVRPWHDAATPTLDTLLHALRHSGHLREFAAQRLAPLLEHDRKRAAKLLPTLEALSEQNWRRTDAARALHLNRQALYARIARIERLLRVDLSEPESRLSLEVAIRVQRQLDAGRT